MCFSHSSLKFSICSTTFTWLFQFLSETLPLSSLIFSQVSNEYYLKKAETLVHLNDAGKWIIRKSTCDTKTLPGKCRILLPSASSALPGQGFPASCRVPHPLLPKGCWKPWDELPGRAVPGADVKGWALPEGMDEKLQCLS